MTRIWHVSIALAPALVLVNLAWMFFYVGFAAVFCGVACIAGGYVAGRLDDPPKHSVRWSIGA